RQFPALCRTFSTCRQDANSPRGVRIASSLAPTPNLRWSSALPDTSCAAICTESRTNEMPSILEIKNLTVRFPVFGGVLLRRTGEVRAVDDVSLSLGRGETLGLVGESGSGKTTVGRVIVNIIRAMSYKVDISGEVLYHVEGSTIDLANLSRHQM